MAVSEGLLAILVCPACRGKLALTPVGAGLVCLECRLRYPVREGIPVLLVEEAEKVGS